MFFNVSGLMKDPIGSTRSYDVEGELPVEGGVAERVEGHVLLLRSIDGVLVEARLRIFERTECSRCLKDFDTVVPVEFDEEFVPTLDLHSGAPADLEERDPEAFLIDENHLLDLTEAVRQYREVSVEMKPLCRPDCQGLCPTCGSDLNLGPCDCGKGVIDSRWAGLLAFGASGSENKD